MFVVDTNVLIYAADRRASGHKRCRQLLLAWRSQAEPWYLTWGIVYEFLRVATHPRVFRSPFTFDQAFTFIDAVLASPSVGVLQETARHPSILKDIAAQVKGLEGNLVFDAHTAVLMAEHGIRRIYTHDADFRRFPFLEVIDPID